MSLIKTEKIPDKLVFTPDKIQPEDKLVFPNKQELKDLAATIALDDKRDEKKKAIKKEEQVSSQPLITKYRPNDFEQVIGNVAVVKALAEAVRSSSRPHTYLFIGPTGVGKTTLARIIAKEIDAAIFEINAAVNSGVDDTRAIAEATQFKPITGKAAMLIIVDEAQELSQKAWSPFLKMTEESPAYLYTAFCTTDASKIPDTITKGRCYVTNLKSLKTQEIETLLSVVSQLENWTVNNDVFNGIVLASAGSARHSLSLLQAGHACSTVEELSEVVRDVESENSPVTKLCQLLVRGNKNWTQIAILLKQIEEPDEAIGHVCNYMTKVMAKSEESQAHDIWRIIQCLSENRAIWDKRIQLYAGIGKYLWGAEPF